MWLLAGKVVGSSYAESDESVLKSRPTSASATRTPWPVNGRFHPKAPANSTCLYCEARDRGRQGPVRGRTMSREAPSNPACDILDVVCGAQKFLCVAEASATKDARPDHERTGQRTYGLRPGAPWHPGTLAPCPVSRAPAPARRSKAARRSKSYRQPRLTKETAVMTIQSFIWAVTLISSLNLSGCTDAEPDQSTALCIEAMELNASQLRWDNARKQEVMNHACAKGASRRTAEQWQCVIAAIKQGESYVKATDTCFPK